MSGSVNKEPSSIPWIAHLNENHGYDRAYEALELADDFRIQDYGRLFGLTRRECLAIYFYTCGEPGFPNVFQEINEYLRANRTAPGSKVENPYLEAMIADLRAGFDKLPIHKGFAFRRTDIPAGVRRAVSVGNIYRDHGFLSASLTDLGIYRGHDILVINSTSGRLISSLSMYPDEQEVVFAPDTPFEIETVEREGSGLIVGLKG